MLVKYLFSFLFIFLLNLFSNIDAQSASISKLTNEEIEKKIDENSNNPAELSELINFYIKKSKKEKNNEALFYAFRYASITSSYPLNLKYADSALITSKKSDIKKIVLDAYLNRGNIYMKEELYQNALNDILVANKLSKESGDIYIYNLSSIKKTALTD